MFFYEILLLPVFYTTQETIEVRTTETIEPQKL